MGQIEKFPKTGRTSRCEKTGGDRQWHGRRPPAGRIFERNKASTSDPVRRRTTGQLQPHHAVARPLRRKDFDDIVIHDDAWYAANESNCGAARPWSPSTARRKCVETGARRHASAYDRLVIATGSNPFVIPVPGANLPGVVTFRDLDDVEKMHAPAEGRPRRGHRRRPARPGSRRRPGLKGMKVSVVHLMPTLMERQLDPAPATAESAISRGASNVFTEANTEAILGETTSPASTQDGRVLPADLVVMAVGIRPNTTLAKAAGLTRSRRDGR